MRSRRLQRLRVLVAVVVGVGGLALAGCRSAPTVAAYVGDRTVTEAQVDTVVTNVTAAVAAEPGTHAPTRTEVVATLVLDVVCTHAPSQKQPDAQPITAETVKQAEAVPANSDYAQARARVYACLSSIPVPADGPAPTEAQLRDVFDRAVAGKLVPEDSSFADLKDRIAADPGVSNALALRTTVVGLMEREHVTMNPRYRPVDFALFAPQGATLVAMTLGQPGAGVASDAG